MRVRTEKGFTDVDFDKFAAVEPKLVKIREDFRAKKIDADAVFNLVRPLFGQDRVHREWAAVVGPLRDTPAMKRWQEWVDEDPKRIKLFYSPETVAGMITQEAR